MAKPKSDLRGTVLDIIMRFFGQQNVLTVSVPLIDATGAVEAALFLSQLIYWSDRSTIAGGWVAKTYAEWYEELRLTKRQVSRISKRLRVAGIETKVAKFAGQTAVHYRIDRDQFFEWFTERLSVLEVTKGDFQKLQNVTSGSDKNALLEVTKPHFPLTETTAETTQKLHTSARERDLLFDAIALHIFGIDGNVPKSSGGRIAKVKKALCGIEGGEVAPARVAEFVRWYKSYHPDMSIPRDDEKVSEYYLSYRAWAAARNVPSMPVVAPMQADDAPDMPALFAGIDFTPPQTLEEQQALMQAVFDRISTKFSGEN